MLEKAREGLAIVCTFECTKQTGLRAKGLVESMVHIHQVPPDAASRIVPSDESGEIGVVQDWVVGLGIRPPFVPPERRDPVPILFIELRWKANECSSISPGFDFRNRHLICTSFFRFRGLLSTVDNGLSRPMKNLAVVNASNISKYAYEPVVGASSSLDRVIDFARTLPEVERMVVLTRREDGPHDVVSLRTGSITEVLVKEKWNLGELFSSIKELSKDFDHLFYCHGDLPLLDREIADRMWRNHLRYFAQYTFADGYPYGLSPEILAVEIIPSVAALVEDGDAPIERDSIFSVIQKDINSFDIETELSPEDMRLLRISLSADTRRNFQQLSAIIGAGGSDEASVLRVIKERAHLLRTLPAYVSIEIIDGCPQACSYCPFPLFGGEILRQRSQMSTEDFSSIIDKVAEFCDDATINLSLWGEPALHENIPELLGAIYRHEGLTALIETSGIGWTKEKIEEIRRGIGNRITWIVSLDALEEDLYQKLRGDGWAQAKAGAEMLIDSFPGRVYVQAVRMKQSEEELEAFYRYWDEKCGKVIVQKYNNFGGLLPDQKVSDLSPLKRFPCWHLKRDLVIRLNGEVTICREDLHKENILGNILKEDLSEIWLRGASWYQQHIEGNYPEICKNCDEYYTYNF